MTIAIAIAGIAITEHLTRKHHQEPSVIDDPVWWAVFRRQVDNDPKAVAFLGTSRMQLAYSAEAFAEVAPTLHGVQLAIEATPPFGILEDLAADEDFHGVAVADFGEWDFARGDAFSVSDPWVDRGHALWRAPGQLVNRWMASYAQSKLAVLAVGGRRILASAGERHWPEPSWVVTWRDRTRHGDYSLAPPDTLDKRRQKALAATNDPAPPVDVWLQPMDRVERAVAAIRSHGGDVVFVHMPITGGLAVGLEKQYPRAVYWDRFAASTKAQTIHFQDVPAMAALQCPEWNHLDQKDQGTFTRALVDVLRTKGVLRGRE